MVTPSCYIENERYMGSETYFGLSTDSKPSNCGNGSIYIAIDNIGAKDSDGNPLNFIYCYDAENDKWYPDESTDDAESTGDGDGD